MRIVDIKWAGHAPMGIPSEIQVPADMRGRDLDKWLFETFAHPNYGFETVPDAHILKLSPLPGLLPCTDLTWAAYRLSSPDDAADVCFALYGRVRPEMTERLDGASYPCWALFRQDRDFEGACEGVLLDVQGRTARAIQDLAARAVELETKLDEERSAAACEQ